jgi:hypothetical protein
LPFSTRSTAGTTATATAACGAAQGIQELKNPSLVVQERTASLTFGTVYYLSLTVKTETRIRGTTYTLLGT